MARLNTTETTILLRSEEGQSLKEIGEELNVSYTTVWKISLQLEEQGLLVQTKKHCARSRRLTDYGRTELQKDGFLKPKVFSE